jgi:hypothetical protein
MAKKGEFIDYTGRFFTTNQGYKVAVIECFGAYNCTVQFEDGVIVKDVSTGVLRKGAVAKPVNRVGEKHITNQGYEIEIIEYFNSGNCTVTYPDGKIYKNKSYTNIKKGEVENPYHPSVCGIGYWGTGKYKKGQHKKISQTWRAIFTRCYKSNISVNSTYQFASIDPKWHNFQVFAEWFEENYKEGFHLDKDILVKGNKIYSSDMCTFVPRELNNVFVKSDSTRGIYPIGVSITPSGRFKAALYINNKPYKIGLFDTPEEAFNEYKTAKEVYIKELAEKWKPSITPETYQALINYQVEITD